MNPIEPELIVDTDVISYISKRDSRAAQYAPFIDARFAGISFMTLAEVRYWARASNWGARRLRDLEALVSKFLVMHSSPECVDFWVQITLESRRIGRPISVSDAWIAATALAAGVPLLTNNRRDFDFIPGLALLQL